MKTSLTAQTSLTFNYGKKAVPFNRISHFTSQAGNYTKIFFSGNEALLTAFTLKHYVQKLADQSSFIVPRKGVLVNKSYIQKLDNLSEGLFVILKSGEKFKVSRRRTNYVLKSFAI